jgi:type 1 glutamine amidotransferase
MMNRRSGQHLLWVLTVLLWIPTVQAADKTPVKILLIATKTDHPWGSHMYMFDSQVLASCLNQTPGVQATVSLDWPQDPKMLAGVKSIVCFSRPAGEIVLDPGRRAQFEKLMKEGVGYMAIHWATGIGYSKFAEDPAIREAYKNILGGWFRRPPCGVKVDQSRLVQVDKKHPICRGWQDYDLRDEFYLDLVFHEKAKPLIRAKIDDKQQVVAWSFNRPGSKDGRSFGTTMGHFHSNFTLPAHRQFMVNAILWTAHVDIPTGGAPVEVKAQDLKLPPLPVEKQSK